MILWILKGMYTVKSEARTHALNQSATGISQQILQAHKSNRQILYEPKSTAAFQSTMETPITLGISCIVITNGEATNWQVFYHMLEWEFRTTE